MSIRYDFTGKVVLVTGSSRGIGAAILESFAQAKATCVVNYFADPEGQNAKDAAATAERLKSAGDPIGSDLQEAIDRTRADYERSLDAKHSAARGYTDAIIDPRHTRQVLALCLQASATARPLICP